MSWPSELDAVLAWLREWAPVLTVGSAIFGVVSIVVTFIAMPRILASLPEDYLIERNRIEPDGQLKLVRNLIGWPLVLLGVILMPLPGQGMLTVLAGLFLADFPGKRRLIHFILRQGPIARGVDAIRAQRGAPPLKR